MTSQSGHLQIFDSRTSKVYKIPVVGNTIKGSDLAKIQTSPDTAYVQSNSTSLRVFDPGYENVAVMRSNITFVDGESDAPALEFRGYSFQELMSSYDYDDTTFLMFWGHMPSAQEKRQFRETFARACGTIPPAVAENIKSFPPHTPYYPMLLAGLTAYLGVNPQGIPSVVGRNIYHKRTEAMDKAVMDCLSAYAIVLGLAYCHRKGQEFVPSIDPNRLYISNVFVMLGIVDPRTGEPDPVVVHAIQQVWIMGCDHEMNNSASALLHAASALADPFSCLISGLSSAFGILHFGAAESSYKMMAKIGHPSRVAQAIAQLKKTGQRIMGVGHRVYKSRDPRVGPMKEILAFLKRNGHQDPLVEVAFEIERQVNADPYFQERKLCVNIDLFWLFAYTSVGIEIDAVLPIALAGRVVGLLAHWREAMNYGGRIKSSPGKEPTTPQEEGEQLLPKLRIMHLPSRPARARDWKRHGFSGKEEE